MLTKYVLLINKACVASIFLMAMSIMQQITNQQHLLNNDSIHRHNYAAKFQVCRAVMVIKLANSAQFSRQWLSQSHVWLIDHILATVGIYHSIYLCYAHK